MVVPAAAAVKVIDAGRWKRIVQTPTITAGAYSADDAVGGLLTFVEAARFDGGGGLITSANLLMKVPADNINLDLFLFHETVTVAADNAAASYSDADAALLAGFVTFRANDYIAATALNIMAFKELSIPYRCAEDSSSIFGQFVDRTGHTYASTADIVITLTVARD